MLKEKEAQRAAQAHAASQAYASGNGHRRSQSKGHSDMHDQG